MRNIYITGVSRTGKTTLCKMIKDSLLEMKFNYISFEALRNGFIKSQPELQMGNRNSEARSKIMPSFIIEYANWNKEITNYPSLIDYAFDSIEFLKNNVNEDDIIICLGFDAKELETIVQEIKSHSKEEDYTFSWSIEQLRKHFFDIVQADQKNKIECIKNNVLYFDTSQNREQVLNNILHLIKENYEKVKGK